MAIKSPPAIASGTKATMNKTNIQVSLIATLPVIIFACRNTKHHREEADSRSDK
jgi:hypothetical protein